MRIQRFYAPNAREAMRKVRKEQGPDAVILSNTQVDGGVELIAAVDYDPQSVATIAAPSSAPAPRRAPLPNSVEARYAQSSGEISPAPSEFVADDDRESDHAAEGVRVDIRHAAEYQLHATDVETETTPASRDAATDNDIRVGGQRTEEQRAPVGVAPATQDLTSGFAAPSVSGDVRPRDVGNETSSVEGQEAPLLPAVLAEVKALRELMEHHLAGVAWGSIAKNEPGKSRALKLLMEFGFTPERCISVADRVAQCDSQTDSMAQTLKVLQADIHTLLNEDELIYTGGCFTLLGAPGVGKTTTIAKIAARHALRYGSQNVALIGFDNHRMGAHEQLRTYARLLNISFFVAKDKQSLTEILSTLSTQSLVLIDTPGFSANQADLDDYLADLADVDARLQHYLVLAASTETSVNARTAAAFGRLKLTGCMMTKYDEVQRLGGILSVLLNHELPLAYLCDGQQVPENIEAATESRLMSGLWSGYEFSTVHADEPTQTQALHEQVAMSSMAWNAA